MAKNGSPEHHRRKRDDWMGSARAAKNSSAAVFGSEFGKRAHIKMLVRNAREENKEALAILDVQGIKVKKAEYSQI
ncbi:MAG: hypothetical protein AAB573_00720 [Patescibacteria group bacterium]